MSNSHPPEGVRSARLSLPRLGDYELLERLGRGGMGEVYRARQIHLQQIVALKVLPERSLEERQAVARFQREMRSIGGLDHPHIVRAFNAGEAEGRHFLVMEFVSGQDLQRLVERRLRQGQGPLGIGAACEVIRQAALGLQYAHQQGLVHRDIKPANLMLSQAGVVKILDFGLARVDTSHLTQQLSQEGMALGTIDYMAPEQAENSSAVDIRADIYSLGCTWFYLLIGRAPFGSHEPGSLRSRLLAHAMAPVPSLRELRPDCPEELDRVLEHLLAKEPDVRFATPGEVAEVLGLFAKPDELQACLVATEAGDQSVVASTPSINSADIETAQHFLSRSPSARRPVPSSGPWHRRPVPLAALSFVVSLALGLGAWALRQSWRADVWPAKPAAAAASKPWAGDLALLPGLNGQWWFDEMPWYLPFVRRAVAEHVENLAEPSAVLGENPLGYVDPNVAQVHKWLWDVVARTLPSMTTHQQRLVNDLKALADANLDDPQLATRLAECLQRFVESHAGNDWSAADWHTRALLQHKLAALRSDRTLAQQTRQAYDEAARLYAVAHGWPSRLRLLAQTDAARLSSTVLGDFKEAKQGFEEVQHAEEAPDMFRAEVLATYGAEAAGKAATARDYEDYHFKEAKTCLERSKIGKRTHPLAAHIAERYAWSLMEQWEVEQAYAQFQEAQRIRSTNQRESQNPWAGIYVFHNQHGKALADRYLGKSAAARTLFEKLVGRRVLGEENVPDGEIQVELKDAERQANRSGQQRYLRDLRERWANSMERWADCEFYGGAASGAAVNLDGAARLYREAGELTNDLGTDVVLSSKLCCVLALHGQVAEARQLAAQLQAEQRDILGPDRERAALLRQVADAVLILKDQGPAEGQKALQQLLNRFKTNPAYTDRNRRETLELQLFCAELLLSSELETQDEAAAQRDLKYLDPLLATFQGRREMRPFLRRYFELAIRACRKKPDDLFQLAQYILESRTGQRQEKLHTSQTTLLLFYFSRPENFAVFLPQDGRPGTLIHLELTREQIKEAASRGKPLCLDDKLVKLVQDETQAQRPIVMSWSDTVCFAVRDEGLAEADWRPFRDQLELGEKTAEK